MTKTVRVENGCNSDYKVIVEVWDKGYTAEDGTVYPDMLAESKQLSYPTDLGEFLLHDGNYLKVQEVSE